ncbi:MAG: hypothetical protein OIN87_06235 [Candidatus Methanoperedens sp.]|nr:hypothetical protein [Candidatus Methanoperedens sp.]
MNLNNLLVTHKSVFRQKFIGLLAGKNSCTENEAEVEFKDFIDQFVDEKYIHISRVVEKINEMDRPVFLNIRRDRMREDRCKICEGNEPNIHAIEKKYGSSIELFEVIEDRPEGALYQIIFQEDAEEKKLPLTALIDKGELIKFWAGKTVDPVVYERYIKKYLP